MGLGGIGTTTYALAATATHLYAGGSFDTIGGVTAYGLARWDGNAWETLGADTRNFQGGVRAIAVNGNDVYVGGVFESGGIGSTANRVAVWNGSAWSTLGSGGNNGVGGPVYALALYGGELYAGGQFTTAGGAPARNIARWNGSGWSSLAGSSGDGVSSQVRALAISDGQLVVGGYFTQAAGNPAFHLARWNGSSWSSFSSEIGGGGVDTLLQSGIALYVGGFIEAPVGLLRTTSPGGTSAAGVRWARRVRLPTASMVPWAP